MPNNAPLLGSAVVADAVVLRASDSRAHIYPGDGGRLGQLDFGDGPLLRGPDPSLSWLGWGAYVMAPWVNRIPGGRLRVGEIDALLPINNDDGTAIHGLVANVPWTVDKATDSTATLSVVTDSDPFHVRVTQSFALSPGALELHIALTNVGEARVPVGLGLHPWFPVHTAQPRPPIDRCVDAPADNAIDATGVRLSWHGPITSLHVYTGEPGWVCFEPQTMTSTGDDWTWLEPAEELAVTYTFTSRLS